MTVPLTRGPSGLSSSVGALWLALERAGVDDDTEEYLDPELDAVITDSTGGSRLPGPITLPRVVLALHLLTAAAIAPLAVGAAEVGAWARLGVFLTMMTALIATGFVVARLTARRY